MNYLRFSSGLAVSICCAVSAVAGGAVRAAEASDEVATAFAETMPADRLVASLDPALAALAGEVLERNPELARLAATVRAAEQRAPQVRSLPDPMASLTAFLLTPETRVGPQRAAATISQRLPWLGKLALREREALYRVAAARAELEARRLALVTETRRIAHELAFLAEQERIVARDRATLAHYEALARARYASGVGLEAAVVKLQAEISKDDNRVIEIAHRRAGLVAALDALRARTAGGAPPALELTAPADLPDLDVAALSVRARASRPEVARARALISSAETASELAAKESRPDLTVGVGYTMVGRREDAPGRAMPPPGNGDDIVGLTLGVNLPVWRDRIAAGVAEAAARETAAAEELRSATTAIDQTLVELAARLPLICDQLRLYDDLLVVQAEQALSSAEAAYSAGSAGALDLLDAERILLDVRIGSARLRADYWITFARLEGALAAPLDELVSGDLR